MSSIARKEAIVAELDLAMRSVLSEHHRSTQSDYRFSRDENDMQQDNLVRRCLNDLFCG